MRRRGWLAVLLAPALAAGVDATAGDVERGRAIVMNRQVGLCLLCHSGPFPEERFQGDLAPDLAKVGARWTAAELRQRLVDPQALNPNSVMPAFRRTEGLWRVTPDRRGQPLLSQEQIDDVVAFLATLK